MQVIESESLGGKGENLKRLTNLGLPVPAWFAIPAEAMVQLTASLELDAFLAAHTQDDLAKFSYEASARILSFEWPEKTRNAIVSRCQTLFGDAPLAVRSSAVEEDGAEHSFAGQFDTYLGVQESEEVLTSIKRCWASAFSERALAYRKTNNLSLSSPRMAVVIQKMVPGEVSGVVFTADPTMGSRDKMVISSTWGLGEGLVSGELDADTYVVCRRSGNIDSTVVEKSHMIVPAPNGTEKIPVAANKTHKDSLTIEQIRAIVEMGEAIEAAFGGPQDIEWTIAGGELFLLQARPITALPAPKPEGQTRLFDNSNIVESYPGVTTPLTFSFVSQGYAKLYRKLAEAMGATNESIRLCDGQFQNMVGLIQGRIYYNLGNWYSLLTYLPGYQNLKVFFSQSIGASSEGGKDIGQRGGLMRLVSSLLRNYFCWDKDIRNFQSGFQVAYEHARLQNFPAMRLDALVDFYRQFFELSIVPLWRAPMVNEFFAMLFYGLLKRLLQQWGIDDSGGLQNDLLCGEGGIESTEPAKAIAKMAIAIKKDPSLQALFETLSPQHFPEELEKADYPAFTAMVRSYINRYGYRCIGELMLESVPVSEDPTFLYVMIQNYLKLSEKELLAGEEKERKIRLKAETKIRKQLAKNPIRKAIFGWVLKNARRGIKNRENMRFARTKVFGIVREIFLAIGKELHRRQLLEHPRDVLYLTVDEIIGWVEGRAVFQDMKAVVALRKQEFLGFETQSPAERFEALGAVYLDNLFEGPIQVEEPVEAGVLRGTTCCPGIVKNKVRVIHKGDDLHLSGEILVAERTDPGWVPLYPAISGLLIERGSVLSHASIVAREMGIPTIVGIKNLTKRVKDGQYIKMDAAAGRVYLNPPEE